MYHPSRIVENSCISHTCDATGARMARSNAQMGVASDKVDFVTAEPTVPTRATKRGKFARKLADDAGGR